MSIITPSISTIQKLDNFKKKRILRTYHFS